MNTDTELEQHLAVESKASADAWKSKDAKHRQIAEAVAGELFGSGVISQPRVRDAIEHALWKELNRW